MFRSQLFHLTLLLCVIAFFNYAFANVHNSKIALVIGNSDYEHLPKLKNASRDADSIARVLSSMGFTVFLTQNTNSSDFKRTLSFVSQQAVHANQIIVYYAGHSHMNGNVLELLSINDQAGRASAISTADLLDYFDNPFAQKAIILDACLELPLDTENSIIQSTNITSNLNLETLLVFATSYGHSAYDGTGSHSLFTGALLDTLMVEKTDLEQTIQSVRSDVAQASRTHQIPVTVSTLTRPFDIHISYSIKGYETSSNILRQSYSSTGFAHKPLLNNLANGPIK